MFPSQRRHNETFALNGNLNLGTGEASRNISMLRDLIGGKEAILPQQGIGTASECRPSASQRMVACGYF